MAKSKTKKGKKTGKSVAQKEEAAMKLTLADLDAVSSSDDEHDATSPSAGGKWNAEALALREAVSQGAFDKILRERVVNDEKEQEGSEFEEVDLEDESDDDDNEAEIAKEQLDDTNNANDDDDDDEEEEEDDKNEGEEREDGMEESGDESSSDDDGDKEKTEKNHSSARALAATYEKLREPRKVLPFAETFCVVAASPLPFGTKGADGSPLDVHDDLKRELAFYNMALESANKARTLCNSSKIPFSRPDDFFAEMVKTDDHMAKVKDRLIFETKKMDAVAQRKVNKEQKLRAKEKHSSKLAEKAKRKKEHLKAVDDWAKTASQNRGSALRDDDDMQGLQKMNGKRGRGEQEGQGNKKRAYANKKYGFGGKTGRFKQNSRETLDDMSGYNPKGNFGGGMKSKGGAGANRKGKRARDASRSRK